MSKALNKYKLRVRAGPSYDEAKMSVVNVNDEDNPLVINSPQFTGYLMIRMLNFNGVVPENSQNADPIQNPKSSYFQGRNRRYSFMVQGRFSKDFNGDDLVFAIELDSPLRLPPGFGLAVKIAQWLDPALRCDLQAQKPWMNSPLICAMNALSVVDPNDPDAQEGSATSTPPRQNQVQPAQPAITSTLNGSSEPTAEETRKRIGEWTYHSTMIPENTSLLFSSSTTEVDTSAKKNKRGGTTVPTLSTYEKRKRFFADVKNREMVQIKSDFVYSMDFYDAYFDFNTISFNLPGFSLNANKYFDGQPMRFVARSRSGNDVFFVVIVEMLKHEDSDADGDGEDTTDSEKGV